MTDGAAHGWVLGSGWGLVDRPLAAEHGGTLYLASLSDGEIHVVAGSAAVVCRTALSSGGTQDLARATAEALGVPVEAVDPDVLHDVVADLVRLGALQERSARSF